MATILPDEPHALLDRETVRQLFRECVTVVQPGETLIVRVPVTWTAQQVRAYQEAMDWDQQEGRPFPVLVVAGEGLGIAEKPDEPPVS